jgi:hypothetical protein
MMIELLYYFVLAHLFSGTEVLETHTPSLINLDQSNSHSDRKRRFNESLLRCAAKSLTFSV